MSMCRRPSERSCRAAATVVVVVEEDSFVFNDTIEGLLVALGSRPTDIGSFSFLQRWTDITTKIEIFVPV